MSTRNLKVCAAAFLLLTIVGARLIGPYNALKARNGAELPLKSLCVGSVCGSPILHVELARNEDDLRAVLKAGDLQQNIEDARAGNCLDSFLFIPGYAGFLLVAGVLLARGESRYARALFLFAITVVPAAALCDELENCGIATTLHHLADGGEPHPGDAQRIAIPSIVKWILIAAVTLIYGAVLIRHRAAWTRFLVGPVFLLVGLTMAVTLIRYAFERFS